MAKFRKVDPRVWNDEKFRAFSDDAKLIFLYLLTSPGMTSVGAMRHTIAGMAAELKWSQERYRERFGEPLRVGMVEYDEDACLVLLPNFLKYNPPENANVLKSWFSSLDMIPECALKVSLIKRLNEIRNSMANGSGNGMPNGMGNRMPNQEPEPEQEPEQENTPPTPRRGKTRKGVDAAAVQIPPNLDTPEFRQAWADWVEYRRQLRKPFTEITVYQQLQKFGGAGVEKSIAMIRQSIANGWQGLFEVKGPVNGQAHSPNRLSSPDQRRAEQRAREYPENLKPNTLKPGQLPLHMRRLIAEGKTITNIRDDFARPNETPGIQPMAPGSPPDAAAP